MAEIHLEELVQPRRRLGAEPRPRRRCRRDERRGRQRFVGDLLKAEIWEKQAHTISHFVRMALSFGPAVGGRGRER